MVHKHTLVGGGLRGTKFRWYGPQVWLENHHQVVVVVVVYLLRQSRGLPCSPLWAMVGPTRKFTKMKGSWELGVEVGDNKT